MYVGYQLKVFLKSSPFQNLTQYQYVPSLNNLFRTSDTTKFGFNFSKELGKD